MRAFVLLGLAAGIVSGISTLTTPAGAATVAYLSRTGSGGSCTPASPCNSMISAMAVAGAGGEVVCLDRGAFGSSVTITASITISCGDGLWENPGFTIAIIPTAGANVVIEGLVIDSISLGGSILVVGGQGSVHLRRVRIGNNPSSSGGFAIDFKPTGPAKLFVSDSFFHDFGASGISGAILLKPASGVTADVLIERTRFENNRFGIVADGTSSGIVRGLVSDSTIAGSANNGITVSTASSNVVLTIDNCKISGNTFGLAASGTNAGMLVRRSVITANGTGLFTASGAVLLSYRDNSLNANTSDGAFTGTVGPQ